MAATTATPEFLPLTLDRRQIYVFPTRYGLLFIGICGVMLFGSVNYNNNLGFLLSFLLLSLSFVSIFHTWWLLQGVRILAIGAQPVFSGEPAVFEVVLDVGKRMRPMITLALPQGETKTLDLLPGDFNRVRLEIPVHERGIFKPKPIRIATHYPLGICNAWAYIDAPGACIVYPRPIFTDLRQSAKYGEGSDEGVMETKGSEDFKELTAYQPGDPIRRISWKAFSRGQGLMSKVFIGYMGSALQLSFDEMPDQELEGRLSALCGLVVTAHRQGQAYSLILPDRVFPADAGDAHRRNCLKALALFGVS